MSWGLPFLSWCWYFAAEVGAETMCSSILSEGNLGRGRGKKAVRSIAGNLDSETFHPQFPQVLN